MKRVLVLGGLVAVLVVAPARGTQPEPAACAQSGATIGAPACSRTYLARAESRTFTVATHVDSVAAAWKSRGRKFLAGAIRNRNCSMFGRYGVLRVRENMCHERGPLRVTVRSVGGPTAVTFDFTLLR